MIKLISYGELSRINPERLYHLYRQVSLTLNTTRAGSLERSRALASLENIEQAIVRRQSILDTERKNVRCVSGSLVSV